MQRYTDYDRVAVVTGSDSGIGEAIAVAPAGAGCDVGVTYRSDKAGARTTAEKVRAAGRRCEVRAPDLTGLPQAAEVVDELAEAPGGLGVLVNCAGRTPPGPARRRQRRSRPAHQGDGPGAGERCRRARPRRTSPARRTWCSYYRKDGTHVSGYYRC